VEALVKSLKNFPVIGILTAEGGQFFGSVAFQNGNGSNFMSKCNSAHSDEAIDVSRSGDGSAMLDNIALTLSVSVQPQVFQEWCKKQGSTAWDSGFLPRALMTSPESTQGTRLLSSIEEENNTMLETPALDEFNQQAYELLSMLPQQMKEGGRLDRKTLDLSGDALNHWVEFYNHIEQSLAVGGYAEFIRPAAARAAENAARLAAIFHVFENGLEGEIDKAHMVSACKIVQWHLSETKRFRYRLDMPEHFVQAGAMSKRIAAFCRTRKAEGVKEWSQVSHRQLLRDCKVSGVKSHKELRPVIAELLEAGHLLQWEVDSARPYVVVNPRLLELEQ
jgi:putative DNA primase/helicase